MTPTATPPTAHWLLLVLCGVVAGPCLAAAAGEVTYNVSYMGAEDCSEACPSCTCLDIYQIGPDAPSIASDAAVVFVHGGLWSQGTRADAGPVCTALAALGVPCLAADYQYSQDLGGCCEETDSCGPAFEKQARQVAQAYAYAASLYPKRQIIIAGHNAGAQLSVLLGLTWLDYSDLPPPRAIVGVDGVYNASMWNDYDESHYGGKFQCEMRQAFGGVVGSQSWHNGSPSERVLQQAPLAPMFLVHSKEDDEVQLTQTLQMYDNLQAGMDHYSNHERIISLMTFKEVDDRCVRGQHEETIMGESAVSLAKCIRDWSGSLL